MRRGQGFGGQFQVRFEHGRVYGRPWRREARVGEFWQNGNGRAWRPAVSVQIAAALGAGEEGEAVNVKAFENLGHSPVGERIEEADVGIDAIADREGTQVLEGRVLEQGSVAPAVQVVGALQAVFELGAREERSAP